MTALGYTVTRNPAAAGLPVHYVIRLVGGARTPGAIVKATGGGDLTPRPPREPITAYADRLGASVVVNASGWWGTATEDGDLMGAQITDGQVVKDWEIHGTAWVGTRCAAIMADGTLRTYDYSVPVAQILADGAVHTFSQGALAIVDGQPTTFATSSTYQPQSARSLLGADQAGDLYLIVVPGKAGVSGATGQQILDLAAPLNLRTLVVLDSGGSVQAIVDGTPLVVSSDPTPRRIPDVLAFTATRIAGGAAWATIPAAADGTRGNGFSGGTVAYCLTPGRVDVSLSAVHTAGTAGKLLTVATLPDDLPPPPWSWPSPAYLNSRPQEAQNARVSSARTIDVAASTAGDLYVTFSYPVSAP